MLKCFCLAFLFLCNVSQVVYGAVNPGQCKKENDCLQNYACISLQTDRTGIERAAQCTPPVACSGLHSGYCPSFIGWKKRYRSITSVCALAQPNNCLLDINNVDKLASDLVDCQPVVINGSDFLVIYGCIDAKQFKEKQLGFNATAMQLESCKSSNSSSVGGVCNGHGTCGPKQDFTSNGDFMEYVCQCNIGYETENNCLKATSNKCNIPGQCAKGVCNLVSGECECTAGYTGLQCIDCDPSAASELQCNNRGTCRGNGTCECESRYTGMYCDAVAPGSTSDGSNLLSHKSSVVMMISVLLTNVVGCF